MRDPIEEKVDQIQNYNEEVIPLKFRLFMQQIGSVQIYEDLNMLTKNGWIQGKTELEVSEDLHAIKFWSNLFGLYEIIGFSLSTPFLRDLITKGYRNSIKMNWASEFIREKRVPKKIEQTIMELCASIYLDDLELAIRFYNHLKIKMSEFRKILPLFSKETIRYLCENNWTYDEIQYIGVGGKKDDLLSILAIIRNYIRDKNPDLDKFKTGYSYIISNAKRIVMNFKRLKYLKQNENDYIFFILDKQLIY